MKEHEKEIRDTDLQKQKIRERYKGVDTSELELIPAEPQSDFYDDEANKRVAVYARVSTDDPKQTSSYELQKNYYTDYVSQRPNWTLVDIYADEGITGTSLKHRDSFNRMIEDCRAGKIDIIVTKSVSRFARNIVDCIGLVRQLASLNPPIGVFFETERLFTLNANTEMSLSFIATMAQEESHTKSAIMNASIEMRFAHGIFLTPPLLGYDQDEDGNLVINEEEAKTVRLIFFMYLYGYTCSQIAETLTNLGRTTKKGNTKWSSGAVLSVLQNERHCGDVLSRKTFTPNYLDHKSRKNIGDRNQYRQSGHHEAIVSADDYVAVQRLISNAKYGSKGILPELHVITEGMLRGFVIINPRWASFSAGDYIAASRIIAEAGGYENQNISVEVNNGDFDMRGFEIARSQFFDSVKRISLTFSLDDIVFSMESIGKIPDTEYIELLVNPDRKMLAVRGSRKEVRTSVKWIKKYNAKVFPRVISGTAFLKTVFELFEWNGEYKYRVRGSRLRNGTESFLIFNLEDIEVLLPSSVFAGREEIQIKVSERKMTAYPSAWGDSFGMDYYRQRQADELQELCNNDSWNVDDTGVAFEDTEIKVTDADALKSGIEQIIKEMRSGEEMDGAR